MAAKPESRSATPPAAPAPAPVNVSVAVGPVSIPSIVDLPQFVVSTGPNQVRIDEYNRWASPLQDNLSRAIAENLVAILGTPRVVRFPQTLATEPDYRVAVEVRTFESMPGKSTALDAVWTVRRAKDGRTHTGRTSARETVAEGGYDALVPAERLRVGLMVADSARANLSLPRIAAYRRRGRLHRASETADATELLHRTKVKPDGNSERIVATLSGGNQQKVLLARWLGVKPSVLLLDEPTQGVDISAKSDVHRLLRETARDTGLAVIVCSTDSIELAELCDRVIVLCRGSIDTELLAPVSADDIERHCLTNAREEVPL